MKISDFHMKLPIFSETVMKMKLKIKMKIKLKSKLKIKMKTKLYIKSVDFMNLVVFMKSCGKP